MIRRWIRHHLPAADYFEHRRWAKPFLPYLTHPNVWAINRRSIAGGVAIGLATGLLPAPFQMFSGLLIALLLKVNLPAAVLTTLYTNPLTIVPLYLFAVAYGHWLLGEAGQGHLPPLPQWHWDQVWQSSLSLMDWFLHLGPALAVGLPATMATFALVGYVLVRLGWNLGIRIAVVRRRRRYASKEQVGSTKPIE